MEIIIYTSAVVDSNVGKKNFKGKFEALTNEIFEHFHFMQFLTSRIISAVHCCDQCAKKEKTNPNNHLKEHIKMHLGSRNKINIEVQ